MYDPERACDTHTSRDVHVHPSGFIRNKKLSRPQLARNPRETAPLLRSTTTSFLAKTRVSFDGIWPPTRSSRIDRPTSPAQQRQTSAHQPRRPHEKHVTGSRNQTEARRATLDKTRKNRDESITRPQHTYFKRDLPIAHVSLRLDHHLLAADTTKYYSFHPGARPNPRPCSLRPA